MRLTALVLPLAACGVALAACGSDSSSTSGGGGAASSTSATGSGSTSAVAASTCATGSLTISGSTALQPLAQKAATAYMAKCSGSTITVSGGGSSTGLANAANGQSDIGMSDVPVSNAKSIDASTVTDHQVAIAVFAVIANPKTNVTSLTTQQIQDLFSGKVTNWKDVGGADVPVTLIERKAGSGTRVAFDKDIMGSVAEAANPASTQDSTSLVLQGVQGADGGVSYLSAASASGVTVLSIGSVKPTADTVAGGTYPFFAHEHMYTKGAGSAIAQDFINYMLGAAFQAQAASAGFLPVATTSTQSASDK